MSALIARATRRLIVPLMSKRARLRALATIARFDGEWEPELVAIERILPAHRRVAIDVGANLGYYTLRLSDLFDRVVSFEINPEVAVHLTAAALRNVTVVTEGLSDTAGRATLFVPTHSSGVRLHGWASLHRDNCPDARGHEQREVVLSTLDSHRIDDVSFMKIDVEGHECEVLSGARETIARWRPVVLIEIQPRNLEHVRRDFASLDYREAALADVLQAAPSPANHLFVPISGPGARVRTPPGAVRDARAAAFLA